MGNTKKIKPAKLTAKETLIAYVSTLSEKNAMEAYQILLERFDIHRARCLKFNRQGIQDVNGKVRLTSKEYQRILEELGDLYFHRTVEILYDYIVYLEEKAPYELVARQRLKEYNKISHYYRLTKGWVAKRFEEENPQATTSPANKTLCFQDISNEEQAQRYINELPSPLRINNPEVEFLLVQYPNLIL